MSNHGNGNPHRSSKTARKQVRALERWAKSAQIERVHEAAIRAAQRQARQTRTHV